MPVSSHFASRRVAAALSSTTLSIAVATLLVACSGEKPGGPPPGFGGPPPPVAVLAVQPQTVPVTLEYTGQTQGAKEVEVRARVTGILLSLPAAAALKVALDYFLSRRKPGSLFESKEDEVAAPDDGESEAEGSAAG